MRPVKIGVMYQYHQEYAEHKIAPAVFIYRAVYVKVISSRAGPQIRSYYNYAENYWRWRWNILSRVLHPFLDGKRCWILR